MAAFFPRANVTATGHAQTYSRRADTGSVVRFRFCPACGATVLWETERKPDLIGVAVGAFADSSFPAPTQAVYSEHRHPWVQCST